MLNQNHMSRLSIQIGFWSATLAALTLILFTICFVVLVSTQPIFMWTNLEDYLAYARENPSLLPDIARGTMLLFSPLFVLMLNSIYDYAKPEHKILVRISLCFGLAFAILSGAHYFIQISAVRLCLQKGELAGIEQVIQANPYSAIAAMNMVGWTLFLGLASLFVAPVFSGSRLTKVIRMAFLLNGIFCLLAGIGYVFEYVILIFLTINFGTGGALLVMTIGLSLFFRRASVEHTHTESSSNNRK